MSTTTAPATVTINTFAAAQQCYRNRDLRQASYDEGDVVMADVLINLHGAEHRNRRRLENRLFRRDTFWHYEQDLFPAIFEETLAPHLAAGRTELVRFGHQLMMNLAALTSGVDRPAGDGSLHDPPVFRALPGDLHSQRLSRNPPPTLRLEPDTHRPDTRRTTR